MRMGTVSSSERTQHSRGGILQPESMTARSIRRCTTIPEGSCLVTLRPRNVRRCATIPESLIHTPTHARVHTHAQRASERTRRERERERERGGERARESARTLFQVRPAHHIVSLRQAYAHLPCFLVPDTSCRRALPKPCNVGPDDAGPPPRPRRYTLATMMSSGFYSQNGRWPDPKSSKQKGGADYFPNYSIFCILLECCG